MLRAANEQTDRDEAVPAEAYVLAEMPVSCKHGAAPAGSPETLSPAIRSSHVFDVSRHASGCRRRTHAVTKRYPPPHAPASTNAGLNPRVPTHLLSGVREVVRGGQRRIGDAAEGVVVPAVGVVVGEDHRGVGPVGGALERVDLARDELLLVGRVRIGGMAGLVG
jgi:hypothetical protein